MKKFLLVLAGLLALSLLTTLGLWLLDIKTSVLPKDFRLSLRQTLGYCIDGRHVYFKNRPFVVGSNASCSVCVCVPQFGGLTCQHNKDITDCGQ